MDQFMNNPALMEQMMRLMQEDPDLMNEIMQNPQLMQNPQEAMNNPRIMNLMQRLMGSGAMPGMGGGMGGGMPSGGAAPQAPKEDLGRLQAVTSTSQYNYRVKEAIQQQRPIVVDFTMQGCRPCQMLKPEIIKMSNENPDFLFLLVDNRLCPEVVEDLAIEGFPTVIFYSTTGSKLTKNDTVVGMDLQAIQRNVNRLKSDIEAKKRQALFKNFKHCPIRESELTYFKQIQWDRIKTKVSGLLVADCAPELYKPFTTSTNDLQDNFSTPAELLTHTTALIDFLANFQTNSMQPIKPVFMKVLSILMEWPEEHFSVALHLFRLGLLHNDFAANIAKGSAKGSFQNALQRLCSLGNEKATSAMNAVLITRAMCSAFEKKILTRTVLQSIDDILGLITAVTLVNQEDSNVVTSSLALLLNTSYMVYCYSPSNIPGLKTQEVMIGYQKSILTTIIETLPLCLDESKPEAIYKLFIAIGTILFPYYLLVASAKESNTTVPALDIKQHLDSIGFQDQINAWKNALEDNKNIQAAAKEIAFLTADLK